MSDPKLASQGEPGKIERESTPAPHRRGKIPVRYAHLLTAFIVSLMMTCIVSGISTLRSIGFAPNFFSVWPVAWAMSWAVAFPVFLFVAPIVRRIVAALVDGPV